ncbi:MAG: ferritin-like domain-containing protein [Myxococcales bacterium]|nr:ferritin-like domain-containing protein [Myxococcales bacterium]
MQRAKRSCMSQKDFRRLLRALLLSAGSCASVGCGGASPTEMPERATCPDLSKATRYTGLTLSPGVDGIAFATRSVGSGFPSKTLRLASLGAPCATAKDPAACNAKVSALLEDPASAGWIVNTNPACGMCVGSLTDLGVITAGDDVHLATLDQVLAAAAPVESRDEAALFVALRSHAIDCATNNVRAEADGWTFKHTSSSCSGESWEIFTKVTAATGAVTAAGRRQLSDADNGCVEGRRPAHLAPTGVPWLSSLSACFSEIAHMEAAAVLAFDELEASLVALGAPEELLARVRNARADEVAHAELTARIAARFGGTPSTPRVGPGPREVTALQLALENAAEGCVREAYGALVAAHQASHARDPEVREAFARIAVDEGEHAELSFALDTWLRTLLTPSEQQEVDAAIGDAWRALEVACAEEPAAEVRAVAGVPTARGARAILAQLGAVMGAAA